MKNKVPKKMLLGFMQVHVLVQAKKEPVFGLWLIEDLEQKGYHISPGTMYPLLAKLESENLLDKETRIINGKNRHYYKITEEGMAVLEIAKEKAVLLLKDLEEV